jgi:hypothetical protein
MLSVGNGTIKCHNIQQNDTQHKRLTCDTQNKSTFGLNDTQHNSTGAIMMNVVMLNVIMPCIPPCHNVGRHDIQHNETKRNDI